MTTTHQPSGLEMAKSIESVVTASAAEAEAQRTLPEQTVAALWSSGLMQWMNPEVASGQEPSLVEMLHTWIELSRQDASVGWIGIANFPSSAFAATYLDDAGYKEVFTDNSNRITMGGQFAPNGMGETVQGGYQLTGA